MNIPWHDCLYDLKFQIGDIIFAKKKFRLKCCEMDIPKPGDMAFSVAEVERVLISNAGYDGYLIRGVTEDVANICQQDPDIYYKYALSKYQRYYVSLGGSFEDYLGKFTAKSRSTLKRKVNKFRKTCGDFVDFRIYKTPDELGEFHTCARSVSKKTYQEGLLNSGLPDNSEFIENMKELASNNSARGYILYFEGEPISYLYLSAKNRVLIYDYLGYDPEYLKWSVGTVLHWYVLESLFNENIFEMLDFTEGEGQQKQSFSTGSIYCSNYLYLEKSLGHKFYIFLHRYTNRVSKVVGDILENLGIKSKIRKLLRHGV